ncbi:MAG: Ig-like domain-containing protein [Oscillospiraceae bacterium]|nr:Ig-like domain-containing protein [Oscillospiraceae bacterium]
MKAPQRIISYVLTAAFLLLGTAAAADEGTDNLLINGDCEEQALGTTGWRFKDSGGWYYESEYPVDVITDNIYEGSGAIRFKSAKLAQRITLKRNVTYELSFAIRADEECVVDIGFDDGSQDWPASYQVKTDKISVSEDWQTAVVEFECSNTQDYLAYFNLWDLVNVYVDDITLKEKDSYISRLMMGVDGEGAVSFSANYKDSSSYFGTALYDEDKKLTGFISESESGTFSKVNDFGTYTVKSYLLDENGLQSKSQEIVYDEDSALGESKSIGKAKSLTLSEHELDMNVDDIQSLDAVLMPEFAYDNDVAWESSDELVAEVSDNGIVTAKSIGTVEITAKSVSLTDSCRITVSKDSASDNITLDRTSVELVEIDSVYPIHANVKDAVWKSDDESIAVVTDGVITAKGEGTTVITAVTADGEHSAECTVNVKVSDNTITNDTFFKDTDGNNIYSQGGGIYKFGDKYYWYGIKYKEAPVYAERPQDGIAGNAAFEAFTCYSSDDLVNWKFEGNVFDEPCEGWAGRMGVCYNENTKKYVLISQYAPGTLFATSDSPTGPFETDHIFTGTVPVENGYTGDQMIFMDEDGKAYMICSSGNGRVYQYVIPLRESDFLDFDYDNVKMLFHDEDGSYVDENGEIRKKDKTGIEGNCMFRYGDKYYFTGSDLYGWNSSRVYYLKADSILGDYNADTGLARIMDGSRSSFAHNSQAGFYVTIHGSEQDLVMYCGDRWADFAGNGIGYNQWIPITMNGDVPYFNDVHQWKLDAEKGTWEVGEGNNYIANSEFEADRKTTTAPAGWTARDNVGGYANSNLSGKQYAGNFVWQQTAPEDYIAELSQDIDGLPDGTYTMTAWVKSSGGQNVCSLYAQSGGEKYSKSVKLPSDEWTEIVISDSIAVTDGKCTVGLYSDAHADEWVQIDNLRLVKNIE